MDVGFAVIPDGSVWAAGNTTLLKINSSTLDVTTVPLPFAAQNSRGAWHPGSITASTKENTIFIANDPPYDVGTDICRYTDGKASSLASPFIKTATGRELYGKAIAYNASKDQLLINSVKSGYGANDPPYDLDFYDVSTGALVKDVPFGGYHFPATDEFH